MTSPSESTGASALCDAPLPEQVVLVLQGGGALGAFQVGVFRALHEAGIEPSWVVGTSIGAINGAIIAGNPPDRRVERLQAFWDRVEQRGPAGFAAGIPGMDNAFNNLTAMTLGISGFYAPAHAPWLGPHANVGVDRAALYTTAPLRETLSKLIDFDHLGEMSTRLTVGAVNARTGAMKYFDSNTQPIELDHVMASGALPPAFPAVRIDGEPYWDGGIYSNTPTEIVFDEWPRRNSLIFAVHLWDPAGDEPGSILDVAERQKEIQYASRAYAHIEEQRKLHRLRHVIRELSRRLPAELAADPTMQELASWGCGTTMQVVRLLVPRLQGDDHTKDIDFTRDGIRARMDAGYAQAQRALEAAAWNAPVDPIEGVAIHEYS